MKEITLNGAKFQVAANTMEELKNEALGDKNGEMYKFLAKFNASEPDIFILDGFATKENLEIKDAWARSAKSHDRLQKQPRAKRGAS